MIRTIGHILMLLYFYTLFIPTKLSQTSKYEPWAYLSSYVVFHGLLNEGLISKGRAYTWFSSKHRFLVKL